MSYDQRHSNSAMEESTDPERDARIEAAREKARAAKVAADRRRAGGSSGEPHHAEAGYGAEDYQAGEADAAAPHSTNSRSSTPIVMKRRPTPNRANDSMNGRHSSGASHHLVPDEYAGGEAEDKLGEFVPPAVEDYAQNERQLDAVEQQVRALEEENKAIDQRLQLYSEVVGMRKELRVVQEDESRLRQQLADTEMIVAAHDPEINKEVAVLEDEAQQSALQNIWKEESAIHNPDKMDWATIDINNLAQRLAASKQAFYGANEKAEVLYSQQDAKINKHTDDREKTKETLRESYDEEMDGLHDARARMRQVESEQRHHRKRGTNRGRVPNVSAERMKINRERRVDLAENRTTQQVDSMNSELTELMEECKLLKRRLDESKRISKERQLVLETQLKTAEEEGAESKELKAKLTAEREELTTLKSDLQGVLHYVRAKNRDEEDF